LPLSVALAIGSRAPLAMSCVSFDLRSSDVTLPRTSGIGPFHVYLSLFQERPREKLRLSHQRQPTQFRGAGTGARPRNEPKIATARIDNFIEARDPCGVLHFSGGRSRKAMMRCGKARKTKKEIRVLSGHVLLVVAHLAHPQFRQGQPEPA